MTANTKTSTRERTLQAEITARVESRLPGVEVLAVELATPSRFCVYIDHPGGVDHALCARVTDVLERYLDEYTVEVSSPGPERPLRRRAHFAAAVGRRVRVRTAEEIGGRTRFTGEVREAGEETVILTAAGGAEPLRIPYEAIVRANLIDEGLRT